MSWSGPGNWSGPSLVSSAWSRRNPSRPDGVQVSEPIAGVFVTGTGTEVGKAVVAAVIARTLAAEGKRVAVFKPAVTGLDEDGEADHELLLRASGSDQSAEELAPYRHRPPASPHLAASMVERGS